MALVARAVGGCGEDYDRTCYAGDYRGCQCPGGGWGYARCTPLGEFDTVCACDGTTPGVDAGKDTGGPPPDAEGAEVCISDAGADGGVKKYLEVCTTNAECETCLCEVFAGSGRCTKRCTSLDPCPAPADACTNRGVCRPGQ
jgi:hypothetical protein